MSRAPIIITPSGRIPGTPILMSRPRHRQEGGPPCDFTGLPVRLDYPRGISGPGPDQESKGSPFPSQSDVSDQNAGRRDNLQTSAGTQDTSWRSPVVLPNNSPLGVVPAKQVAKS